MAGGDGPPVAAPVTQCVGASPPRAACGRVIGPWTGVRIGRGNLFGSGHAVQRRGQLHSGLAIMPLLSPVVRVPSATSRAGSREGCGLPMPGLDRPWICSARCAASPERRTAFEFLVGESASDQLSAMEHDIRVRGRLRWSVGPVVADAMRGCLWIGLPPGGIHVIGQIERDVRGVLVVENADTFQYVCLRPDVTDTWLCVWGRGSTTDGVVNFLRPMNDLPIAVWCDLDARGIEIVTELAGRLGREITPVGMGIELLLA